MSKPLPTGEFEWMTDEELNDWGSLSCMLEVDLEYPKELHNLHNDYALAPEHKKMNGSTVKKLIPNLSNKTKYIIHHENLKLYLSLGLKLTKIHRGLKFKESPWLKQYIDLNTDLRKVAKNDFEKDFYKLMNNSVFGKTMENIENRIDVRLVSTRVKGLKLTARPNYHRTTIFDENLAAIHMKKTSLYYNKPVYLGFCILDLSKILMYDMHYNHMKKKYGDRIKLLFTDTDSLCYDIKTEDFFKDMLDDLDLFDNSEYPEAHMCYNTSNKKVLGKFKDEAGSKIIDEFVGLRSKLYSYKMFDESDSYRKCKGIKKSVITNEITHEDYKECLFSRKEQLRSMNVLRSHLHDMYSEQINKVALSSDDDKRIIRDDGIHTYAIGHYAVNI